MAKPSNGLTPQQVNDAQHLDNMTSLQQPSAAEQSPITQNGEVKGDAPISSPPTPNPDNPSLFNEPKNPNNKVVEVESQKTSEDLDKGDISDTPSDQGAKFTEDLKGLSGDAINLTITAQTNEQGVPGDKQPELDPGVNKAGGNTGNQGPTGGGGIPRAGQAPAGTPAAASPTNPSSPTSQLSSPTSSQSVEPGPRTEPAPPPPSPTPPTQNLITPQPLFVPEQPKVDAPSILAPDAQTIPEDSTAVGNVLSNDSDVDSALAVTSFSVNGITYTPGQIAVLPGIGSVTIASDGTYLFTPEPNWNGAVPRIDYITNTEAKSTLNIAVTPTNDTFTDGNEVVSTDEDTPISGNVLGAGITTGDGTVAVTTFSVAGDGTTYTAGQTATISGVGTITIATTGAYTFTPAANYNGPVPVITYAMSDDGGATTGDTSTLTISVTSVNDTFTDGNEVVSTDEDTPISGNVLGAGITTGDGTVAVTTFSVAGDGTTYTAGQTATISGVGTITIATTGAYTFTPAANYNGPVPVITYAMSDDGGATTGDTSTLTISVTSVNDTFTDGNEVVSTDEDTPISGNVLGAGITTGDGTVAVTTFSVAGDGTTYTAGQTATISGVGTITIATTGAYTFTPAANYNGPVPVITYAMSDDGGATTGDTSTLTISVTSVNDTFTDGNEVVSTDEDTPISGNVLGAGITTGDGTVAVTTFSVAGDGTTYTAGQTATISGVGTITIATTGAYTFTPAANYNGPVPVITYAMSDDGGATTGDTSTLTISVTSVNDTFTDGNEVVSTDEDTPISGNVLGAGITTGDGTVAVTTFSVAGDGTTYTAGQTATISGVGTITIATTGAYTFTPAANYNGPVPVITYAMSDDGGATTGDTSTLTISVIAVGPTIGLPTTPESTVSLITGDTSLTTTVTGDFSSIFASAASSGTVTVSGYSFVLSSSGVSSGLTSQGSQISLFNNSGIISGKIGNNSGVEVFRLSVDSSGVVSLTQYQPIDEAVGSNVIGLINSVLSLQASVSTNDNGQIATGTVSIDMGGNVQFTDATPTLNVLGISANNVAGTTSGTYTWNAIDADNTPFTFTSNTATTDLKWDHPSDDGYTFALKAGTTSTYEATYQDKGTTKTYFEITVNDPSSSSGSNNGTYNFVLVTPKPTQTIDSGNLFSALTPTNLDASDPNTEALVVGAATFGGAFSLVMTGSGNNAASYGGATTLNKSATDIGVNGNTIQSNGATKDNESIKIDIVQQAGFETSAITGITLGVSSTASLSTSTQYYFKSTYVDGTQITGANTTYDGSGFFTASFNPTKVIDYVEFFVISSNYKITSVNVDYVKKLPVTDDALNFTLVGTDFDGDISNLASFTVNRIAGTAGADDLSGTSLSESISGGAGVDKLTGGAGADTLSGGSGLDTFVFSSGASGQTDALADQISDYTIGAVGTGDLIDYSASMVQGGSATAATATQAQIGATGVATFASGEGATLSDALADITARFTAATDTAGEFAFFKVNGTGDYYLFISDGSAGVTANDVLIKLVGVTAITAIDLTSGNLTITKGTYNGVVVTPIAIDLNQDGIKYLNQQAQVVYDYTGQNLLQSTAWVSSSDGLLALKLPSNQLQISFATQAGETDLQGLAKVYDTNHDNIFDAQDAVFNQFGVWQDADSDGVVDSGEFLSLADRGIISLSLTSDGVINTAADGDVTIYGQTTYTMTDGSTGIAEDVGFSVGTTVGEQGVDGVQDIYQIASVTDAPIVVDHFSADDRDRIDLSSILNPTNSVQSTISIDTDGSTSTHSTITVNIGGVDYEVATLYGKDIGVEDALGTHPGGASLTDSLNGASWTDVVDISSEHGGPASIFADGGSLTNSYSNEAGDWTVQIKSGTATVDALNKQITFSSDNAENLAIITTADGTSHEIANVDKILWH